MRIITRADFDGVVCAALIREVEEITEPVLWVEPGDMQNDRVAVRPADIIANLPYHENCALWFDHHFTNKLDKPFKGAFWIAPSAARVIFDYYKGRFKRDYTELVRQTDKIDAADLTENEVLYPENYPYILLSMTVSNRGSADEPYWNQLVEQLGQYGVETVMQDAEVKRRCEKAIEQNVNFRKILQEHTRVLGQVAVTDLRSFFPPPSGNRFLAYSLFPQTVVSLTLRRSSQDPNVIVANVGHSIFNRKCRVNLGLMLSEFGGGGHRGAGSCRFPVKDSEAGIARLIDILVRNEPNEF